MYVGHCHLDPVCKAYPDKGKLWFRIWHYVTLWYDRIIWRCVVFGTCSLDAFHTQLLPDILIYVTWSCFIMIDIPDLELALLVFKLIIRPDIAFGMPSTPIYCQTTAGQAIHDLAFPDFCKFLGRTNLMTTMATLPDSHATSAHSGYRVPRHGSRTRCTSG